MIEEEKIAPHVEDIKRVLGDKAETEDIEADLRKYLEQYMVPLTEARAKVGDDVTLCGNFDPSGVLLQSNPQGVADAARACVRDGGQRFILMPGCEVPPNTPEENIRAFCPCEGSLMGFVSD